MMKVLDDPRDLGLTNPERNKPPKSVSSAVLSFSSSSSKAPRTKASDRLFKVMLLIVAFAVLLLMFSAASTAPLPSDRDTNLGEIQRHQQHHRLVHDAAVPNQRDQVLREFKHGRPRRRQPETKAQTGETPSLREGSPPPYHMVFSTSCSDQQHWESYVFFYHAYKVQQQGTVTRICSGCNPSEAAALQTFHDQHIRTMNENFHLHLTPDFASLPRKQKLGEQKNYKYMNKPYGLRHWMDSVLKMNDTAIVVPNKEENVEDGIVFLLDPDMILLRPLVHNFTSENVLWVTETGKPPLSKVVKHGFPLAQQDGYLTNQWMYLNASYITQGGNINHLRQKDGPLHYNTGPPYLATVKDMYAIACMWCDYAPRVYDIHPKLFAEMFGFIFATTQLNLPHTLIRSIVVSTTASHQREGWPYVDALSNDQICDPPKEAVLPVGLHYCKRYLLDHWFFSKYRLKKQYISCKTPMLEPPPLDLATRNFTVAYQPPPHGHKGTWEAPTQIHPPWQAKREAFMLCALIQKVNEAARYFKDHACDEGEANLEYYNFFSDPDH